MVTIIMATIMMDIMTATTIDQGAIPGSYFRK